MTWSKFDDLFDEHEKVEDAWFAHPPNPVGLFVMATTACNRWLSDGVIRPRWLERKLPKERERAAVLATMVEVALFDLIPAGQVVETVDTDDVRVTLGPFPEDRYVVHDFLDRHDSKRQVEERRSRDSARKRRGFRKDSARIPDGVQAESAGNPNDPSRARPLPDPTRPDLFPPNPPRPAGGTGRKRDREKLEQAERQVAERRRAFAREHFPDVHPDAVTNTAALLWQRRQEASVENIRAALAVDGAA